MKRDIHPKVRPTVFKDSTTGRIFILDSTIETDNTIVHDDGNVYPLVMLSLTSDSHPFFTGAQKYVDTAGRIEKFNKKYNSKL